MTVRAAITVALPALAALIALLAVAIVARRAWRRASARRVALRAEPLRPLLLELAGGEAEAESLDALLNLDPRDWRAIEPQLWALAGKIRGEALDSLIDLLTRRGTVAEALRRTTGRSALRRATAAELLGSVGGPDAVSALCRLLHDRSAEVRVVAARSLGRVADPVSAGPLLAAMNTGRPVPPMVVAQSLLRLGPAATPALIRALEVPHAATRMVAAQILGLLGAAAATPVLTTLVERDAEPLVRLAAVRALGRIGMPGAAAALVAATAAHEDDALRAAAASALGDLGPDSAPVLADLLSDPVHQVAHNAAAALCGLGQSGLAALRLRASGSCGASAGSHAAEALALAALRNPAVEAPLPLTDPAGDAAPAPWPLAAA